MKNISTTAIILAILSLGVGFGLGTVYQKNQISASSNFGGNAPTGMTRGGGTRGGNSQIAGAKSGFRPIAGEILSADDKSVTVKLVDGSSKIVLLTDKTVINKAQVATKTDLKTGEKVSVFGQTNTDGSVSAQNIQLNPLDRGAMGQPQTATKAAN